MPSKKIWIVAGVLFAGAGATAIAAHGFRGGSGYGGRHHSDMHGSDRGDYRRHGRRDRGPVDKQAYDARSRARFAEMDINSDGTIDADEAKAVVERRMQRRQRRAGRSGRRFAERMTRRFDIDKDGKVPRDEFDSRIKEIFDRADLDSDGRITDADLPPMMRGRNVLSGKTSWGHRGRRRGARFLRFLRGADRNGDDVITFDEAKAVAAQKFSQFDRNQDGTIDSADLDSLNTEIIDYRIRRFMHRYGASGNGQLTLEQFMKFRNERFARMDFNSDGELSRDERPHMRGHKHGGHRSRHHRGRGYHRGGPDGRRPHMRGGSDERQL